MDCVPAMNPTSSSNVEVTQTLYGPRVVNKTPILPLPRHPDLPQSAFRRVYPPENHPCQNTLRGDSRDFFPVDRTVYGRATRFSATSPYPRRPAQCASHPPPSPPGYPPSSLVFVGSALQRCADSFQRFVECSQGFTGESEVFAQTFHDALGDIGYVCREAVEESRLEAERWKTRCMTLETRLELLTLERKAEADRRSYGNLEEKNIPPGLTASSRPRSSSSKCGLDDFFDVTIAGYDTRPISSSFPPQLRRIGDEPPRLCPRPAKPGGLDMGHLDLMYTPRERQLVCCACTRNTERKGRRSGKRKSVKTFPNDASWNELLRHWLQKHPTECRDIANIHPANVGGTLRRPESTTFS